ncbi:MAG: hypothetical protein JNJ54_16500 [Myxococcaceae bacterium]|nr:hypothetical protein [Myxococcaceae bacterium]
MRWPALLTTLTFACATSSPAPAPVTVKADDSGGDVASAFEEPVPVAPTVTAKPPPPLPDLRAPFREALEAGQRALASRDLDGALTHARRARKESDVLGVAERVKALELSFKVAMASTAGPDAQRVAREWLSSCSGDGADACRAQALNALLSTSQLDPSSASALRDEVAERQKAEACLKTSERAKKPERCFAEAEKTAKHHRDELLLARASYVRALAAPEPRQPALFSAVEQHCDAPACLQVRRRALGRLLAKARADKRLEDAARFALRDAEAFGSTLAEAERVWGRPPEVDVVCAAYDDASGAGACRKLEKQLTGRWTFRDFSKDKPREGLSGDQVRAVNEHYAPLLQECLSAQARRLRPPDAVRYELRWMVFNDGRVGEVHFKDGRHDDSELAKCLRAQFETWRYPRYEGEWQHVEQAFTVSAVERRSER